MTWFSELAGFADDSPENVLRHFVCDGDMLKSTVNGQRYAVGTLETPTLAELRAGVADVVAPDVPTTVHEVVADVQDLHADPRNAGASFQVASQFNLLEMVSPSVSPEAGVSMYEFDRTQGPACAIAAGAGTIYRNYFLPVGDSQGQSADRQIDCLADLGRWLGNDNQQLWKMKNGYVLATATGLADVSQRLATSTPRQLDQLRGTLRIGVQSDTQVTLGQSQHQVTQLYCSALPVAYSSHAAKLWAPFGRLVLEAAYEAAICAAVLNGRRTGHRKLFLTLLGGGAFGNPTDWIIPSIDRAINLHSNHGLDIQIVSYGSPQPAVQSLLR